MLRFRLLVPLAGASLLAGALGGMAGGPAFATSAASRGGAFTAVAPALVLDTAARVGAAGPVGAGKTVTVTVAGRAGIPKSGAAAVALDVTVSAARKGGSVTVYAAGSARPATGQLDFAAGQVTAGLVIVKIGAGGKISLRNNSGGTVQLTAAAGGWFAAGKPAALAASQLISDDESYCALFTSGSVDCWGYGLNGGLGDGSFTESATPQAVVGLGGKGTLTGVSSLGSDGTGICAVLGSGGVDCWGYGGEGELGDGSFGGSDVPVAVKAVGGKGTLTGVASLASYSGFDGRAGYCALLKSGGVDCWGWGPYGQLGNGKFYLTGSEGSDVPVAVKGTGGSGTLSGVASLASQGSDGDSSYCALLKSGGVDCWGYGPFGQLGNGTFYTGTDQGSAVPVAVAGIGGSGTLTGVAHLSGGFEAFCAVLDGGGVACWGYAGSYQLGNGQGGAAADSASPVAVSGPGGTGTLTGVAALQNDGDESYCARQSTGSVVCWGGDAIVPATVAGAGGTGTLTGVAGLAATGADGPGSETYCAVLTSGKVDCWGNGFSGQLGNGSFDSGSVTPIPVEGLGGTGTLSGVTQAEGNPGNSDFCAVLSSGRSDCWGYGEDGELGNGAASDSDVPVAVAFP